MKIAIVEDERLFRDVLRKACTMHLGHEVVGEAGSGREALLVVPAALPDLLVLDIHLPDMDGLDVLRFLRRKRALLKALLISSYFDDYTLCRIEQATVQGFIDKSTNTVVELGLAISAIEGGATYFPSLFTEARRAHSRNPFAFEKAPDGPRAAAPGPGGGAAVRPDDPEPGRRAAVRRGDRGAARALA